MPWSNQGGGPWGSGSKGPWGSGPQSGGPTPPDLEDLLRRSQDKLRTVLPGGNLGGRGLALLVLGASRAVGRFRHSSASQPTSSASCCASASMSAPRSPA